MRLTIHSSKKNGLYKRFFPSAHHTLTFGESRSCWYSSCGFSFPQILQLCRFTWPEVWKVASSEKIKFERNRLSLSIFSISKLQPSTRAVQSSSCRCCTIWILYARNFSCLCKILWTVAFVICNWRDNLLIDVCGLSNTAVWTSFTSWSATFGLPGLFLFLTSPSSLNRLTHARIKFLCGGVLLNSCRNLLWALTIDPLSSQSCTHFAFSATVVIVNKRTQ